MREEKFDVGGRVFVVDSGSRGLRSAICTKLHLRRKTFPKDNSETNP